MPKKLQNEVLRELHRGHQSIARMKTIARSYVWWPGLAKCLENVAKNCRMCKSVKSTPTVAPLHPWSYRSTPHATTNRTPSSLFLKRELRTRMDLLRPDSTVRVGERQLSQKCDHNRHAKGKEYSVGDILLWPEIMEMVQSGCSVL